jgi:hypothetical protein
MSKSDKLIDRFLKTPTDFTWEEATKLLGYFGYIELKTGKTGGSRRRFINQKKHIINLHKPHPGNILKHYQLKILIDALKEEGHIE